MEEQLAQAKHAFLQQYNDEGTIDEALSKSIKAAVQRNPTYHKNCGTQQLRVPIRNFWKQKLEELSEKYTDIQDVATYESDILYLQDIMNTNFRDQFQEGFKVSHSQKSLSVFLKHLWCMGQIATPPQCPVDRIVLRHVGFPNFQPSWTQVNTIEDHRVHINLLFNSPSRANSNLCLAKWELLTFGNGF